MIFYSFSPIQKKVAFAPHRPDKRAGPHSCSDVRVKTILQMLLFELMGKPMLKHRVGREEEVVSQASDTADISFYITWGHTIVQNPFFKMSRPEILVIMTFMTNILNSF
jgi:hypothetical protein